MIRRTTLGRLLFAGLALALMTDGAMAQQNPVNLTTGVIGNGTIVRTPDETFYPVGTVVSLIAIPDDGFAFESWSGPVADPDQPETTVVLKTNTLVSATFVPTDKPQLQVKPAEDDGLDFGTVETGLLSQATERTLTVTNVGGGTLEGTANVRTGSGRPYRVLSGGSFSLDATESAEVRVAFDPFNVSLPTTINDILELRSNGGDADVLLTGVAVVNGELGCSCATIQPGNPPWGDLGMLVLALAILLIVGRWPYAAQDLRGQSLA